MLNLLGFLVSGIAIVCLGLLSAKYVRTIEAQRLKIERLQAMLHQLRG